METGVGEQTNGGEDEQGMVQEIPQAASLLPSTTEGGGGGGGEEATVSGGETTVAGGGGGESNVSAETEAFKTSLDLEEEW